MAKSAKGSTPWTAEKIYHLALSSFASILYDLLLILVQSFEPFIPDFCPSFLRAFLYSLFDTGNFLLGLVLESCYFHSESPVDVTGTFPVFGVNERERPNGKLVLGSASVKLKSSVGCTAEVGHFNAFDRYLEGMVSRLPNYKKTEKLYITAANSRETESIFPIQALPSFWCSGESSILLRRGTDLGEYDTNLHVHVSMSGKVLKVPKEHDCLDFSGVQDVINIPANAPADAGETPQGKNAVSHRNEGQKVSGGGIPVAEVHRSREGGRPSSGGSSGSGGNDGGDDRRPNVPIGGCQGDSQCLEDDEEEECEKEQEEQKHQDDDDLHADNTNKKEEKEEERKCLHREVTGVNKQLTTILPVASVDGVLKRSSDQGLKLDVNRARQISQAAIQGARYPSQITCHYPEATWVNDKAETYLQQAFTCRRNARAWEQCSHTSCRAIQQSLAHTLKCRMHVLGGCKQCIQYKSTLVSHASSCKLPMGKCIVNRCDDIRRYLEMNCLPDNRKWTYELDQLFFRPSPPITPTLLGSPFSAEVQQSLSHTRKCRMHVLGGCKLCTDYKDIMLSHASGCELPLGRCGVRKCNDIRKYLKTNRMPEDTKWTNGLDQLFFEPSLPRTPSLLADTEEEYESFSRRLPNGVQGMTSLPENSPSNVSRVWDGYHMDRLPGPTPGVTASKNQWSDFQCSVNQPLGLPVVSVEHVAPTPVDEFHLPDLTVSRGPTVDNQVRLQHSTPFVEAVSATTPLSAMQVPDASQGITNRALRKEVIWPLNTDHLSVGEDGCYVEDVHWRRVYHIGGGSCGRCYYCTDLKTGFPFAVKWISEGNFKMTEIEIWGNLSGQHPNIVELFGAVKSQDKVTIFMEYMEGGSVENVGKMHEQLACHIFGKVLAAVDFMHSQGMVHRDIKGANILIDETGEKVKLADFGTSIWLSNGFHQDNMPRGTEPFMAPEVCRSKPHSFSADIWSLMCVLYQMLKGVPPWEQFRHCHRFALLYQIGEAKQPPPTPSCSPELEDLFSQGFQLEPTDRPTAKELLNHAVFLTAPDIANIEIPTFCNGYDPDYESSLSSLISGAGESLVSHDEDDGEDENKNDDDDDGDGDGGNNDDDDDDNDDDVNDDDDDNKKGDGDGQHINDAKVELWPGQSMLAEQQLESLQSNLFQSLSDEELSSQEDFDIQSFIDQINLDATGQETSEWSTYSMSDLTKLHIKNSDGNLLFTIRERPTTTYGSLGKDHHGNIASVLQIEAFALTNDDGSPLDVHAEIGGQEQAVRVVPAHDTDNWEPYRWRVDAHGLVEQWTQF